MQFFLDDPEVNRLPPVETHLTDLHAEWASNSHLLRVTLDLTPFQRPPYVEIELTDGSGQVIASTSIIEPVVWKLELNLHMRGNFPDNVNINGSSSQPEYTLLAILSYPELGETDRRSIKIKSPE